MGVTSAQGDWDVLVVGAGLGGSLAATRLAERGHRVLVLESGALNPSPEREQGFAVRLMRRLRGDRNADPNAWPQTIMRYERAAGERPREMWPVLGQGPGGSSALYGAALGRFRREDFEEKAAPTLDGEPALSTRWPIAFDEMARYYAAAEDLMRVVGERDPLDPDDGSHPADPPPLSARDAGIADDLRRAGMHPYRLRVGIDYAPGCDECQGRRCARLCKADGYSRGLLRVLGTGRVAMELGFTVTELAHADGDWLVIGHDAQGNRIERRAPRAILAMGALNTPLILARSAGLWRNGGLPPLLGRGLMFHLSEIFLVAPHGAGRKASIAGARKTLAFRDLYGGEHGAGEIQSFGVPLSAGLIMSGLRGMLQELGLQRLRLAVELARPVAWVSARLAGSAALFATIQPDLPYAQNRVWEEKPTVGGTESVRPRIAFAYAVAPALRERSRRLRQQLGRAFAPNRLTFLLRAGTPNWGHPMGTCRMGSKPEDSVVDANGQIWGLPGLFIADASVFPSSGGAGPSLTVAALALRLGDHVASLI